MPTYVYGCIDCQERSEVVHRMNDIVNLFCPKCQKPMRRIPQRFGVTVKIMAPGLRNTREIHFYLKEKYYANKTRREANREATRKAAEHPRRGSADD